MNEIGWWCCGRSLLALFLVAVIADRCGAREYNERVHYDFYESGSVEDMLLFGVRDFDAVQTGKNGVELRILATEGRSRSVGLIPPLRISGDFEITARYKILYLPTPHGGYGAGAAIVIELGDGSYLSLQRVRHPDGKHACVAHRALASFWSSGHRHETVQQPCPSEEGYLRVTREGEQVRYQFSEDGVDYRELWETELSGADVNATRIAVQNGEVSAAARVSWQMFDVQADEIIEREERAIDGKLPWFSAMSWIIWALFPGILVGVLLLTRSSVVSWDSRCT